VRRDGSILNMSEAGSIKFQHLVEWFRNPYSPRERGQRGISPFQSLFIHKEDIFLIKLRQTINIPGRSGGHLFRRSLQGGPHKLHKD
jgi:hypothetical protein